jgi:excisionase family DNA binding protein
MQKSAYTVREILHEVGFSRSTLYLEIAKGRLKAHKIGKKTIFLAEDVRSYLESLPEWPAASS